MALKPKASDESIVSFISRYRREHGYAPSVREIMVGTGYESPWTVRRRLGQMRDRGIITFDDGKPRTIVVTEWAVRG